MGKLWNYLERIGSLLEPDERQSVLGDIRERGADWRAALDVTGLVVMRQFQGWRAWRPWALAAALYLPARIVAIQTQPLATLVSSGQWVRPWGLFVAGVFAWALGYSLGRLGGRRGAALIVLLPVVFGWDIRQVVNFSFGPPPMTVVAFPSLAVAARLALLEHAASIVSMMGMLAIVVVPCFLGFARGIDGRRVPRVLALTLVASCVVTLWSTVSPMTVFPSAGLKLRAALIAGVALWPMFYTLVVSRRSRTVYN